MIKTKIDSTLEVTFGTEYIKQKIDLLQFTMELISFHTVPRLIQCVPGALEHSHNDCFPNSMVSVTTTGPLPSRHFLHNRDQ